MLNPRVTTVARRPSGGGPTTSPILLHLGQKDLSPYRPIYRLILHVVILSTFVSDIRCIILTTFPRFSSGSWRKSSCKLSAFTWDIHHSSYNVISKFDS